MTKTIISWGLIVFLILFSAIIYTEIQGYLAVNAVPLAIKVFSAESKTLLAIIFITVNFIGAILTAIVTALPCGYLASKQYKIIVILFIISTQSIPIYVAFQEANIRTFVIVISLGQFITGVISFFAFAKIGSCIAVNRQGRAV